MLAVKIYCLDGWNKQQVEGEFISENGKVRWEPAKSGFMAALFDDYPMQQGQTADEWVTSLQEEMHGYAVRASAPVLR